ncbi:MAG: hypothetical protein WCC36_10510 [Gammaproteobacteria bacterium]
MDYRLKCHARRTCLAVAAASVLSLLGIGTVLAQTFDSVDFDVAPKTNEAKEVGAGDLICDWRESGLGSYSIVSYDCAAQAVGAVVACIYKNKIISNTVTITAQNVSSNQHGGGGGGGEGVVFIAGNNGRVNGTATISLEHIGGPDTHQLCPEIQPNGNGEGGQEPAVEALAVRYCNMSITDTTNNIVGGTQGELLEVLENGSYTVPSCTELLPAQ